MWLSTYTVDICADGPNDEWRLGGFVGFVNVSIGCGCNFLPLSIQVWATSQTVSVVAQKYAGLSFQPICSALGTTIMVGVPGAPGMT
jgi:hypothetical protein